MPDEDRRDVALGGIAEVVAHSDEVWPGAKLTRDRARNRAELSDGERDVLHALSEGRSREEAAASLGITLENLKDRLKRVRSVLGTKSTLHAVAEALRRGLIE